MAEARATITKRRRVSAIWLVPIIALALGAWMVIHTLQNQGPEIQIVFASGEGIEAGKTKIKLRDVEVGLVESIRLADDFKNVVVISRLDKLAAPLLREDTKFWVVRPRIGPGGVSGMSTLLSGGYIQLTPGEGKEGRHEFIGLEVPPVTPPGVPGLRFRLVSERAGSVSSGDPILYKGFRVGRIDSAEFDVASQSMKYGAFIEAPYHDLVTSSTRFWNSSGVTLSATAGGFEVDTGSLETILLGGVAFGLPEGVTPGQPVEGDATFELYPSRASVNERPYQHAVEYVVEFTRSVRGLKPNAPVEFRGIPVGRVDRILLDELKVMGLTGEGRPIPVLIRVEPGLLGLPDSKEGVATLERAVTNAVGHGLRATLATGSLLTGSLYVSMGMYPDEPVAKAGRFAGRATIPTVASGIEGIEQRIVSLLDKVNALPVEKLLDGVDGAVTNLNVILKEPALRALPQSLEATLADLRVALTGVSADSPLQERLARTLTEVDRTLGSLRSVLETIDEKPNSLIFSRELPEDPMPQEGSQ
jgi:paraquat-inducible protein B